MIKQNAVSASLWRAHIVAWSGWKQRQALLCHELNGKVGLFEMPALSTQLEALWYACGSAWR